ncbi:MAG: helix-turn-helix domain-containing protein [Oscillospiraceae bacterium]|nr:helix-turn-helix domain-containing protein [Oscillospiraceae bacterium]
MDIGQTIKKLRKERNFTQEELAEQLNVTPQAVSRWENGTGLPDISQIVPLASVFGISTDVLFGTIGTNDDDEVAKILEAADALDEETEKLAINDDFYWSRVQRGYEYLIDALKKYPNNMKLLREALFRSVNLAAMYRWNKDDERAAELYAEAEREANLMITYGDLSDALYGHQLLAKLYAVFGDFDKAEAQAAAFPDDVYGGFTMNSGAMTALVRVQAADHDGTVKQICTNVFSLLNVLDGELHNLATAYVWKKQYEDAIAVQKGAFKLLELVYNGGEYTPTYSRMQVQHTQIAECYLLLGDEESAYEWLEKFVDFHIAQKPRFDAREKSDSPLVRELDFSFPDFPAPYDAKAMILQELDYPWFKGIREQPRFQALLERANAL